MIYTNLILFACGLGGILIHNLMKMDEINRKCEGEFKFGPYLKVERFSILISFFLVLLCLVVKTEIKALEVVGKWLGLSFVTIGYMAQSIVIKYAGKAEKLTDKE